MNFRTLFTSVELRQQCRDVSFGVESEIFLLKNYANENACKSLSI